MGLRVFLAEDARNMYVMFAALFAELGDMTVGGSARTEAEALLWLDEHPGQWDLAVVDLSSKARESMSLRAPRRRTRTVTWSCSAATRARPFPSTSNS